MDILKEDWSWVKDSTLVLWIITDIRELFYLNLKLERILVTFVPFSLLLTSHPNYIYQTGCCSHPVDVTEKRVTFIKRISIFALINITKVKKCT